MASFKLPHIVGVVNITSDSFSDGGKFLDANTAIEHAEQLLQDGADILDLGAAASNPHAEHVDAQTEIERLAPVVSHLKKKAARISIDCTKPEVQKWALAQGVGFLNDIRGFPDTTLYAELARSQVKLIAMHFIQPQFGKTGAGQVPDFDKVVRQPKTSQEVFDSIYSFFEARLKALRDAGIKDERIIIDPGMGFFLASNPEPSFSVLKHVNELKERFKLPLMIGVSRKSFLKNLNWRASRLSEPKQIDMQARTFAAELYCGRMGVDYIRTHEVAPLAEGIRTIGAIFSAE